MLLLIALAASSHADRGCAAIDQRDLLDVPAPAVLVLGEEPGWARDARRAARVARALRDRGVPVTLALEALPAAVAPTLDGLRAPEPDLERARDALAWDTIRDVPYAPYRPLLALGLASVRRPTTLLAVGQPPVPATPPPTEAPAALVARITEIAPDLPYAARVPVAAARAATDVALAEAALAGWTGQGVLVVVADRSRVAGDGGLPYQLAARTDAPVRAATLAWRDIDCVDGTWQWRPPTISVALPELLVTPRAEPPATAGIGR
jgi:hypothetical protein